MLKCRIKSRERKCTLGIIKHFTYMIFVFKNENQRQCGSLKINLKIWITISPHKKYEIRKKVSLCINYTFSSICSIYTYILHLSGLFYSFAAAIQDMSPHFSNEPTLQALRSVKTGVKLANVINSISRNGSLSSVMSKWRVERGGGVIRDINKAKKLKSPFNLDAWR